MNQIWKQRKCYLNSYSDGVHYTKNLVSKACEDDCVLNFILMKYLLKVLLID